MGEGARTSIKLSHPPTPPALNVCVDLACKPIGCHVDSFPQPPSPHSIDLPDCSVLCSLILGSTSCVHEDQVVNEVGVVEPT